MNLSKPEKKQAYDDWFKAIDTQGTSVYYVFFPALLFSAAGISLLVNGGNDLGPLQIILAMIISLLVQSIDNVKRIKQVINETRREPAAL